MAESWKEWIEEGNLEQYRCWLTNHLADVNESTEDGVPAVRYALYYGRHEIADMLVEKGAHLDLFSAAAMGNMEVLKNLVESSPDVVRSLSSDGYPALSLACFFNHPDCAAFLLEKGANVNQPSENAQKVMPIHAATAARSEIITEMLLERGADANAIQNGGFTPLHAAAQNGDLRIAVLLINSGADPNKMNDKGLTALDIARENHFEKLVDLLSRRGL